MKKRTCTLLTGKSSFLTFVALPILAGLSMAGLARSSESLLPPMNGNPADFAPRRAGEEVNAVLKITVTNEGLFHIDHAALVRAGVDASALVGEQIRLFCRTQEVSLFVSNDGLWMDGDYLVFFGKPWNGLESDANVYWLGIGGAGKRMEQRFAGPTEGAPEIRTAAWNTEYRPKSFFKKNVRPMDTEFDHWFAQVLGEDKSTVISIPTECVVTSQPVRLTAVLYGDTSSMDVDPDHCTRVKVNGRSVASFVFDGQDVLTGTCTFRGSILSANSQIWFKQIPAKGVAVDSVFLKELSLAYTRHLRASADSLIFEGQAGTNNYRLQGFSGGDDCWVLDVTDPDAPVLLTDSDMSRDGKRFTLRFGDATEQARRYAVYAPARVQTVARIHPAVFANLADPNRQIDYLVICPVPFQAQAQRLVDRRADQGLAGMVVVLPDIYNEFSYGIADAGAIKQFLGYAYHHWQSAPRYVLLAGSGSYDPKGLLVKARGKKAVRRMERIPLHMGPSMLAWTSQDGWYAQVDGDDLSVDFALGRLPAQSVGMLSDMIDKVIAFESVPAASPQRKRALLVSDKPSRAINGKALCEGVRSAFLAPDGFWVKTAYNGDLETETARRRVANSMNDGVSLTCYFGHGSVDHWGDRIMTTADVPELKNSTFPIMMMMACLTGALQNPLDGDCLVESLLNAKDRGASACVANTAPAYAPMVDRFSVGFLRTFTVEKALRLGDAYVGGMGELFADNPSTQMNLYLNLFGDPGMIVNN